MSVVEVNHPLIKHKLGLMREADISTKRFRELASEVGCLLTYEATKNLEVETTTINSWNGEIQVEQIKGKKVTVVPILRAGLGMMDGVLELIPSARISVVGMYRNEETLEPVFYFEKLAGQIEERLALVIDPYGSYDRFIKRTRLYKHQSARVSCCSRRYCCIRKSTP